MHYPQDSEEWFRQLTAESLTWRYYGGMKRPVWSKVRSQANEALDLAVGNRAVHLILGCDRWSDTQWHDVEVSFAPQAAQHVSAVRPVRRPMLQRKTAGKMFDTGF